VRKVVFLGAGKAGGELRLTNVRGECREKEFGRSSGWFL